MDLASREQKRTKKTAITLLQVKTNLTISANLTKAILFNRKIFLKNSPKTACTLIKLAQKTQPATAKNFPQRNEKTSPILRENRPTGNTADHVIYYSYETRHSVYYVTRRSRTSCSSTNENQVYLCVPMEQRRLLVKRT